MSMFMNTKDSSSGGWYDPGGGMPTGGAGGGGGVPEYYETPTTEMTSLTIPMLLSSLTVFLNGTVFIKVMTSKTKTFRASYYQIVSVFMAMMAISGLLSLAFTLLMDGYKMDIPFADDFFMIVNLFTSFFSVVLIFMVGFNRFAVFTSPALTIRVFTGRTLPLLLLGLGVVCLILAYLVVFASNMHCAYSSDGTYGMYAQNMELVEIAQAICYLIPICSFVFYVRVYFFLRNQRENVIHSTTRGLLNKAEKCTLHHGTMVLGIYVASLLVNIALTKADCDSLTLLHCIQKVLQNVPCIFVPLSALMICDEVRSCVLGKMCMKVKRVGSAESSASAFSIRTRSFSIQKSTKSTSL